MGRPNTVNGVTMIRAADARFRGLLSRLVGSYRLSSAPMTTESKLGSTNWSACVPWSRSGLVSTGTPVSKRYLVALRRRSERLRKNPGSNGPARIRTRVRGGRLTLLHHVDPISGPKSYSSVSPYNRSIAEVEMVS